MSQKHICFICGRTNEDIAVNMCSKFGHYLCGKHRRQFLLYGKFFERTMYDNNEYIIYNDHAEIVLRNKEQKIVGYALIDLDDIDRCKNYKWSMRISSKSKNTNYAITHKNKKDLLFLHRLIMDYEGDECVDHINRNGLDNRKNNLRIVSHTINNLNASWDGTTKKGNRFVSYFKANNFTFRLGSFKTKEEASKNTQKEKEKYIKNPELYIKEYNEKLAEKKLMRNIQKTKFNTWKVRITVNKKSTHVGHYKTLEEAIEARDKAEMEVHQFV